MSLPNWVKIWLIVLNAIFLAAFLFPENGLATVVLTAYVASGPLLLGFALAQGGLTRLTGAGHLIPWIPLLVALLYFPASTHQVTYVLTLGAALILCLILDFYDLGRWICGDRAILQRVSR